jgi:hypothetical protein
MKRNGMEKQGRKEKKMVRTLELQIREFLFRKEEEGWKTGSRGEGGERAKLTGTFFPA